jgi:hypothetical protein
VAADTKVGGTPCLFFKGSKWPALLCGAAHGGVGEAAIPSGLVTSGKSHLFSSQMMLFECLLLCEVCGPHLRRACFVSTLKLSSQNHRLSELNRLWELIHVQSLWTLVSRSTGEFIKSENARSLPPKNLICRVLSRNPGTCIFQKVPKWPWSSTLAALPGELYINVNAQASSLESLISNFILFCGSRTRVWI